MQSLAHLVGDFLQAGQSEVELIAIIPIVLLKLVQIGAQQLAHQEQVLLHTAQVSAAQLYHKKWRLLSAKAVRCTCRPACTCCRLHRSLSLRMESLCR